MIPYHYDNSQSILRMTDSHCFNLFTSEVKTKADGEKYFTHAVYEDDSYNILSLSMPSQGPVGDNVRQGTLGSPYNKSLSKKGF